MAAKGQWNIALLETDKPHFNTWLALCRERGAAINMADAIRLAVSQAIAEAAARFLVDVENGDKTT